MEAFFRVAEAFRTQDEPAFCGLGTLVTALNALEVYGTCGQTSADHVCCLSERTCLPGRARSSLDPACQVDPGEVWKGTWRWYVETMLDCCVDIETVKAHGITWDTWACLARCQGPPRPGQA